MLSANLKAEAIAVSSSCVFLVELGLPGGTLRYAQEPVSQGLLSAGAASLGHYAGSIKTISGLAQPLSDRAGGLQSISPTVTIVDDANRTLERIFEGAAAFSVRGSSAVVKVAANLTPSDWHTYRTLEIDGWKKSSEITWELKLRCPDLPLRRQIDRNKIMDYDWPNAPQASLGKSAPLLYGRFDSRRWGAGGMIPTIDINSSGFERVVCLGRAWAVPRVFKIGTGLLTLTTDYAIEYQTVNGRTWTVIDLVAAPGSNAVSCDAYGYETVGDGTGSPILNPADQLKHFLVNFVFGDYGESGTTLWAADGSAPVNVASFAAAAAFLTSREYRGSRYLAESKTGLDELNQWCLDHWAKAFWTPGGEIGIHIADPTDMDIYQDNRLIVCQKQERDRFAMDYDGQNLVGRIIVSYAFDNETSGGGIKNILEVRNQLVTENAPEEVSVEWADAHPTTLPNNLIGYAANTLELWFRGDQISGRVDGETVSQWNDESGAARHFTQGADADRPHFRSHRHGINGLPALEFDGTTEFMATTAVLSDVIGAGIFTLYCVFQATTIDTNAASTWQNDALVADAGGFWGLFLKSATPTVHAFNWDGSDDNTSQPITTGVPYLVRARHASGTLFCSVNGGVESSVASGNTLTLTNVLRLGRSSSTNYYSGLIGELCLFSVNLVTPDLLELDEYFLRKWGI